MRDNYQAGDRRHGKKRTKQETIAGALSLNSFFSKC